MNQKIDIPVLAQFTFQTIDFNNDYQKNNTIA